MNRYVVFAEHIFPFLFNYMLLCDHCDAGTSNSASTSENVFIPCVIIPHKSSCSMSIPHEFFVSRYNSQHTPYQCDVHVVNNSNSHSCESYPIMSTSPLPISLVVNDHCMYTRDKSCIYKLKAYTFSSGVPCEPKS